MKKLLLIISLFIFCASINAQQTEDDIHVGGSPKGKTFGDYKAPAIIIPDVDRTPKPAPVTLTGIVLRSRIMKGGDADSLKGKNGALVAFDLKLDDGSLIRIGTSDYGFHVPRNIIGHRITLQAVSARGLKTGKEKKNYQQQIEYAATGLKVLN
jgi:hypothetical protein